MTTLNSSSRLKVKRDTFFVPDSNGGVYFRNNVSSFRLEGRTIYQWIEKLLPMFDGEQTLGDLTKGLATPYQNRVYELSEMLVKNGFVRDLSRDKEHHLNKAVLDRYACQIEFIESFTDSAAYRFQQYRQTKPLVIGSGNMAISLVSSLIESGITQCDILVVDSDHGSHKQLEGFVQKARSTEADVNIIEELVPNEQREEFWRETIEPYKWVLYFTEDGHIEQLLEINQLCKQEKKSFIPATCLENVGLVGPAVIPEEEGCFESAWRRLHQSVLKKEEPPQKCSSTASSVLANIAVFEFFKRNTGAAVQDQKSQIYLLDLETLEGEWLSFIPHPLTSKKEFSPKLVANLDEALDKEIKRNEPPPILEFFSLLTSKGTGIFHTWEERNLSQLPLAQCYVQAVDPLSDGPAQLLPEVICGGFTHQEALREAGLTGIEMYVSKWMKSDLKGAINTSEGLFGIGAGQTIDEAVCRALEACLDESLKNRNAEKQGISYRLKIGRIEDRRCRFYFHALTTLNGIPSIGTEEDLLGFPVIWIRSKGRLYKKAGLNITLALRGALKDALLDAQNNVKGIERRTPEGAVFLKLNETKLEIPPCEEITHRELLRSATQVIKQTNRQLEVYDLSNEPFLKEELAGVFGVSLREVKT